MLVLSKWFDWSIFFHLNLQANLFRWEHSYDSSQIYFKNQVLCETITGNSVNLLTITAQPQSLHPEYLEYFSE